jgi:type I pantothenate kinase
MSHSPFTEFNRKTWGAFRRDTPLVITESETDKLQGFDNPISFKEVEEIYLPLSKLINMHVEAMQNLHNATSKFLDINEPKTPFILGVSGAVAVGKSTTSRILQALLSGWPTHKNVALISTDNFLFSNEELGKRNLMEKKGFPESYDLKALLKFVQDIKSGKSSIEIPVYSHEFYDILPNEKILVENPNILILEGLNVLQVAPVAEKRPKIFISDYFDFSIYVDADIKVAKKWFLKRFLDFKEKAKDKPELFMHQFSEIPEEQAVTMAEYFWHSINELNYFENIEPFKQRAKCILFKDGNHSVSKIFLRN